eukprot:GHVT01086847.1.p1 GENE.GHVT01086847.1~~GHVT01086847.1.p1  ORF type:complete len:547 (+),score=178.31 GHVT01086847.1:604-2244(+)
MASSVDGVPLGSSSFHSSNFSFYSTYPIVSNGSSSAYSSHSLPLSPMVLPGPSPPAPQSAAAVLSETFDLWSPCWRLHSRSAFAFPVAARLGDFFSRKRVNHYETATTLVERANFLASMRLRAEYRNVANFLALDRNDLQHEILHRPPLPLIIRKPQTSAAGPSEVGAPALRFAAVCPAPKSPVASKKAQLFGISDARRFCRVGVDRPLFSFSASRRRRPRRTEGKDSAPLKAAGSSPQARGDPGEALGPAASVSQPLTPQQQPQQRQGDLPPSCDGPPPVGKAPEAEEQRAQLSESSQQPGDAVELPNWASLLNEDQVQSLAALEPGGGSAASALSSSYSLARLPTLSVAATAALAAAVDWRLRACIEAAILNAKRKQARTSTRGCASVPAADAHTAAAGEAGGVAGTSLGEEESADRQEPVGKGQAVESASTDASANDADVGRRKRQRLEEHDPDSSSEPPLKQPKQQRNAKLENGEAQPTPSGVEPTSDAKQQQELQPGKCRQALPGAPVSVAAPEPPSSFKELRLGGALRLEAADFFRGIFH